MNECYNGDNDYTKEEFTNGYENYESNFKVKDENMDNSTSPSDKNGQKYKEERHDENEERRVKEKSRSEKDRKRRDSEDRDRKKDRSRRDDRDRKRHRSKERSRSRSRSRAKDKSRSRSPKKSRRRSRSKDKDRSRHDRRDNKERSSRGEGRDTKGDTKESGGRPRRTYRFWDVPPKGYEHMTPREYKELQANGQIPRNNMQSAVPVIGPSVTCQSRRLYVGNIPFGCNEQTMLDFFNQQMTLCRLSQAPGNPVLACQINLDKNFAFIEFRSIDETTAGMAFDGINFMGQQLKIRRPRDYQPIGNDMMTNYGISSVVQDSPHKLFIGGLPTILEAEQVKELLQSFGPLKSFNLVKDGKTGISKGYAFCEYADPALTDQAIAGLNGMELEDKKIIVQLACTGAKNPTTDSSGNTPLSGIDLSQGAGPVTEILCLLNMVTEEELRDDEEYEDIVEDIREECSRYGEIRSIEVPRPIEGLNVAGVGKVFIEYASKAECQKAVAAITGRKFDNRIVCTSYFDPEKYYQRAYD
uniref:Splicing factor U2AF subunit n=1 Tax=Strongyloides papillosus TaxID=174720 RepID=A0A0N5BM49_STREA